MNPGAIYHVINRGNQRGNIFKDDHDRQRFLGTLGEACPKTEWQIHAWCLMRNHFHLKTPQANLVAGMKWLLGVYTKRYNIRHKTGGHLSSLAATKHCWSMAAAPVTSKPFCDSAITST